MQFSFFICWPAGRSTSVVISVFHAPKRFNELGKRLVRWRTKSYTRNKLRPYIPVHACRSRWSLTSYRSAHDRKQSLGSCFTRAWMFDFRRIEDDPCNQQGIDPVNPTPLWFSTHQQQVNFSLLFLFFCFITPYIT